MLVAGSDGKDQIELSHTSSLSPLGEPDRAHWTSSAKGVNFDLNVDVPNSRVWRCGRKESEFAPLGKIQRSGLVLDSLRDRAIDAAEVFEW